MITSNFIIHWMRKFVEYNDVITWESLNNALINNLHFSNSYLECVYNTVKGDLFEILTKYMLINMGYKYCYLYKEIPLNLKIKLNLPNNDRGIDIICSKNNANYIGIQCKWRTEINCSILKCYVTEFLREIDLSKLDYGVMVSNVKYITPNFSNE